MATVKIVAHRNGEICLPMEDGKWMYLNKNAGVLYLASVDAGGATQKHPHVWRQIEVDVEEFSKAMAKWVWENSNV